MIDPSGLSVCKEEPPGGGGCGGPGVSVAGGDDEDVEDGYSIFDALEGEAGTYTYTNMYGQMSFGFSQVLWGATMNFIDTAAQTPLSFPVSVQDTTGNQSEATLTNYYDFSSSGWSFDIRDLGNQTEVSSVLVDAIFLSSQAVALYQSDEAMKQAVGAHINITNNMVANILLNDPKFQQMLDISQQIANLLYPLLILPLNPSLSIPEYVPPPNISIPPGPIPNIPPPPVQMPAPPSPTP